MLWYIFILVLILVQRQQARKSCPAVHCRRRSVVVIGDGQRMITHAHRVVGPTAGHESDNRERLRDRNISVIHVAAACIGNIIQIERKLIAPVVSFFLSRHKTGHVRMTFKCY